jgi:hypothetical protein
MIIRISTVLLAVVVSLLARSVAEAADGYVQEEDRIIAGDSYLSQLSKSLDENNSKKLKLGDQELVNVLTNTKLTTLIIAGRKTANVTQYFVFTNKVEETTLRKLPISQGDYEILLKFAKQLK